MWVVTVLFPPIVALICAAAGTQAVGPLRPAGPPKEEAAACGALHNQRYSLVPDRTLMSRLLLSLCLTFSSLFFILKWRGTSAASQRQQGTPHSMERTAWNRRPLRFPWNVQSRSDEYSFQREAMTANTFRFLNFTLANEKKWLCCHIDVNYLFYFSRSVLIWSRIYNWTVSGGHGDVLYASKLSLNWTFYLRTVPIRSLICFSRSL